MSHSLLVFCAACNKPVIAKHKSKRRTCSPKCYMRLLRADKKVAEQAVKEEFATQATAEQAAL